MKKIKKISKKPLSTVLSILLVVLSLPVTAFATSSRVLPDGVYIIESGVKKGMVADIAGAGVENSINFQLYEANNTEAQKFVLIRQPDGSHVIVNVKSRKAVDVAGGRAAAEVNVQQYELNSTKAQSWYLEYAGNGYYYIRSALGSNLYLDVCGAGTSNGTNIWIHTGNKSLAQKWKFIPVTAPVNNPSVEDTILQRLNAMMDGSYGNGFYKLNIKYTGQYASEQCKGFAKKIHQDLFGYNIGRTSDKPNNYQINITSSNTSLVGSLTFLSSKNNATIGSLFDKAKAGDFIQVRRSHGGSHSMIYLYSDNNTVTVYECNVDGRNTIIKRTYDWAKFRSDNAAVSIYTAKNYTLK